SRMATGIARRSATRSCRAPSSPSGCSSTRVATGGPSPTTVMPSWPPGRWCRWASRRSSAPAWVPSRPDGASGDEQDLDRLPSIEHPIGLARLGERESVGDGGCRVDGALGENGEDAVTLVEPVAPRDTERQLALEHAAHVEREVRLEVGADDRD